MECALFMPVTIQRGWGGNPRLAMWLELPFVPPIGLQINIKGTLHTVTELGWHVEADTLHVWMDALDLSEYCTGSTDPLLSGRCQYRAATDEWRIVKEIMYYLPPQGLWSVDSIGVLESLKPYVDPSFERL